MPPRLTDALPRTLTESRKQQSLKRIRRAQMPSPRDPLSCCLAVFVMLVASACGDSAGPGGPQKVGLRAGTVTSADGRAAVDVPAGALSQNIIITVSSATNPTPNTLMVGSTAYDLGANGTQFSKPLTLTIAYDPAKFPAGGDKRHGGLWEFRSARAINSNAGLATGAGVRQHGPARGTTRTKLGQ